MFVAAIAAGATSLGVDVHIVGVRPDAGPRVPRRDGPFAAGIMVSASHNPADDNGLKVLDAHGLKLDDAIEDELEQLIWRTEELAGAGNAELGPAIDATRPLAATASTGCGLARPIDGERPPDRARCARTARARPSARRSSPRPAPTVEVIHAEPDGININVESGATAPASLAAAVVACAAPTSGSPSTATPTG